MILCQSKFQCRIGIKECTGMFYNLNDAKYPARDFTLQIASD
jgi:hypothetical protein